MANEIKQKESGEIVIKGRREMSVGGVEEVMSFDEESVRLQSIDGELWIEGSDIKIGALDTETGLVTLTGRINAMYYTDECDKKRKGFLGRFMR